MHVLTILCDGGWMSDNLSEGWRRLGCTVEEFFYGTHMGKSWDNAGLRQNAQINARLLATARQLKSEGRLDLIFAVIYDDVLEEETARELRKIGVPMVNYHVDLVGQWYRVLRIGKYFDRVACAQEDHWRGLSRAGIRPFLMPMAANPQTTQPQSENGDLGFDGILYLGSPWLYRRKVLTELAQQRLPLRVYGHNWLRQKADAANEQPWRKNLHDLRHYLVPRMLEEGHRNLGTTIRHRLKPSAPPATTAAQLPDGCVRGAYQATDFLPLVRSAAVNLGFTHFSGMPGTQFERRQVRLREFEIPMAGGFYLTQDCAQLRSLFQPGRNVEVWNDLTQLTEKARYYLSHPVERQQIAQAGQEHCLRHHTWEARFSLLLQEIQMPMPERRNVATV